MWNTKNNLVNPKVEICAEVEEALGEKIIEVKGKNQIKILDIYDIVQFVEISEENGLDFQGKIDLRSFYWINLLLIEINEWQSQDVKIEEVVEIENVLSFLKTTLKSVCIILGQTELGREWRNWFFWT